MANYPLDMQVISEKKRTLLVVTYNDVTKDTLLKENEDEMGYSCNIRNLRKDASTLWDVGGYTELCCKRLISERQ